MNQKTKDTINELVRRERINEYHDPITDMDIKDMINDLKKIQTDRNTFKWLAITFGIVSIILYIATFYKYSHYF